MKVLMDWTKHGGIKKIQHVSADNSESQTVILTNDGILWGVENGADNLNREDLGGDIHNDNPAEGWFLFFVVVAAQSSHPTS